MAEQRSGRESDRSTGGSALDDVLARSVADDLLVMHYQPRVRVLDGAVVGFEALMRLRTGDGVLLTPSDFLGRAEATGALGRLESTALRQVCLQADAWRRGGFRLQAGINVSAARIADAGEFQRELSQALADGELPPRQLILEVPARLVEHLVPETVRALSLLKGLGVVLSLEDFGAGSVTVEELAGLGFGEVKLDRRLVAAIPGNAGVCAAIRTYATQVRAFGLRCVAAGVETQQQHVFLVGAGIEFAQGYYYERPLPADSFAELIGEPVGVVESRR